MTLKSVIEALLFSSQSPLTPKAIRKALKEAEEFEPNESTKALAAHKEGEILLALNEIREELLGSERCYLLEEVMGGFQLVSRPHFSLWVRHLFDQPKSSRLSQPALETLAIIAYRQPISRAEMEAIRGVAVDGVVTTLQEKGLIRPTERSAAPGRPILYVTTEKFLQHFGLKDLTELPNADELKRVALPKPAEEVAVAETVTSTELPLDKTEHEAAQPETTDRPSGSPDTETAQPAP